MENGLNLHARTVTWCSGYEQVNTIYQVESMMQQVGRHRHEWTIKGEKTICALCKKEYVYTPKKNYKPRSSAYITPEKANEIIAQEMEAYGLRWATLIKILVKRGLRCSEAIGGGWKPGIRVCDIDQDKIPEAKHTFRIWRKRGKFKVMSLRDDIYDDIMKLVNEFKIKPTERIFFWHRTSVYGHLRKYGYCVDERYPIGVHTMRRTYGKDYLRKGGKLSSLQQHYSHAKPGQTLDYVGETEDVANQEQLDIDKMEADQS